MSVGYNPQVNDYVVWTTELGQVHKGWVYFVADKSEKKKGWQTPARYISIEIATKPRPDCDLSTFFHKRIHVCLLHIYINPSRQQINKMWTLIKLAH